jgi:diaminopimelate epimerase
VRRSINKRRNSALRPLVPSAPSAGCLSFFSHLFTLREVLLEFTKMNGAGNDFVLLDNREGTIALTREQIRRLCHRQNGVGADGLMLLIPSSGQADWAWEFYNSDGSTAGMCGNGARCFARFIQSLTGAEGKVTFETGAGIISAEFQGEKVSVNLTPPSALAPDEKIALSTGMETVHSINTGVPHAVLFVPDADQAMIQTLGPEIRFHPRFAPQGTNVNFVQLIAPGEIRARTYERGVEGETLACGTGVAASALISARVHRFASPIKVRVQGGDLLEVSFEENDGAFGNVRLSGPADFVFRGEIEI